MTKPLKSSMVQTGMNGKFRISALLQAKGLWHVISHDMPTQYEQESVTIPAVTDKEGRIVKEAIQGFQDTSK